MRVVFSRKGFDSGSGGAPSPIVDGQPISLPIPASGRSQTTYDDLGFGSLVEQATRNRHCRSDLCHADPMFENGRCAFGQHGASQSHLKNNGVGIGDIFLFFGLFSEVDRSDPHHRIFGYLRVEEFIHLGANPTVEDQPTEFPIRHPHTIGMWDKGNHLYLGEGYRSTCASDELRLTKPNSSVSVWIVPPWLRDCGLTYHKSESRWTCGDTLSTVGRGQEFVSDIGRNTEAMSWVNRIVEEIRFDQ